MVRLRFLWVVVYCLFSCPGLAWAAVIVEGDVYLPPDIGEALVGVQDDGALTVTSGPSLDVNRLVVAQGTGVVGDVQVDGGAITVGAESSIGDGGIGRLAVHSGGVFTQESGTMSVGAGDLGTLSVTGAGSVIDLGSTQGFARLFVAGAQSPRGHGLGRGEVLVADGGRLVTREAVLGDGGSAEALVEGGGALWRSSGPIEFANAGLTIRDGGRFVHSGRQNTPVEFGAREGTTSVLVTGPGSTLTVESLNGVVLGESGSATVRVEAGADVVATRTSIGGVPGIVNQEGQRRGVLELDGFGTTWTTGQLDLGSERGIAEVRVSNGAALLHLNSNENGAIIAPRLNSHAIVSLNGPNSRWNSANDDLYVGLMGRGELRVTGGAYHENGAALFGTTGNGEGSVLVSGDGSFWNVRDEMRIMTGDLTVASGGQVWLPLHTVISFAGELVLQDGALLGRSGDSSIQNVGIVRGSGSIDASLTNQQPASVVVGVDERLEVRRLTNRGRVSVQGGELVANNILQNFSRIDLENATLTRSGPQQAPTRNESSAEFRLVGGDNRVYSRFENQGGRVTATGDSTTRFYDEFLNNGLVTVSEGSTVFFLGAYSGAGNVLGGGRVVFEAGIDLPRRVVAAPFETDVALASGAHWTVEVDHSGPSVLASTGSVELAGSLGLEVHQPFSYAGVHELTIVEASALSGRFDAWPEAGAHVGSRALFRGLEYTGTSAVAVIEQLAEGDYNGDGDVDAGDYHAWAAAYGSGSDWLADGNLDGVVNGADYTLWREALRSAGAAQSVPEPAAAWVVLMAVAAVGVRRATYPAPMAGARPRPRARRR